MHSTIDRPTRVARSLSCALAMIAACEVGRDDDSFGGAASISPPESSDSAGSSDDAAPDPDDDDGGEPTPPPASCDSGYACVPAAPPGWTGPFALFDGDPAEAPGCGGPMPTEVLLGHAELAIATDAQCEPCTCDTALGDVCGAVPVTAFQMSEPGACGGCSTGYQVPPNSCFTDLLACGDSLGSIVMEAAPASGGSCTPSVPQPVLPELQWSRAAIGCSADIADVPGCAADETCMPLAAAPFEDASCVMREGDLECPGAHFADRRVFHLGAKDERGCNACSCSPTYGATCQGTLELYGDNACGQAIVNSYNVPAACTWKSVYTAVGVTLDAPSGGICDPSGGGPTGSVAPDRPVTVCCSGPIDSDPQG